MTVQELVSAVGRDHWVSIQGLFDGPVKRLTSADILARKVLYFECQQKLLLIIAGRET